MNAIAMLARCRARQLDGLTTVELTDLGVGQRGVEAREAGEIPIPQSDRGRDDVLEIVDAS